MYWERQTREDIHRTVFAAVEKNASYSSGDVLGFPGSHLDREVFPDAPFLADSPYLTCLRENPNHIGCHTLAQGETAFGGTQALEREVIHLCAEEFMGALPGACDGYIAPGGTECNIQALWVQRNYLRDTYGARSCDILVLHSEDTHYSIEKAGDLLGLPTATIPVHESTRQLRLVALRDQVVASRNRGVRFFIMVLNLGTTMFGSVDDIDAACEALDSTGVDYRIHVDGAFGGFIYPFTNRNSRLSFRHPKVVSVTMDGHKMLQSPYGTGVFLVRKRYLRHVCSEAAQYVHGKDFTLCGSRSGAASVAMWMILRAYGSEGREAFVRDLVARTDRLCESLAALGVRYFRDPHMNLVTLCTADVPTDVAERFGLVPDTHEGAPKWWKIVVMDHVRDDVLRRFLAELSPCESTVNFNQNAEVSCAQ